MKSECDRTGRGGGVDNADEGNTCNRAVRGASGVVNCACGPAPGGTGIDQSCGGGGGGGGGGGEVC